MQCLPQCLQELLFEGKGANSVAWNSHFEDMLCFSGNGQLVIKTGDFPLHVQKMQGFVVGFKVGCPWQPCMHTALALADIAALVFFCICHAGSLHGTMIKVCWGHFIASCFASMHIPNQCHCKHRQHVPLHVQGCKVFCLQYVSVATIDVPQSGSMNSYLEKNDVDLAYKVACLGVTESDWRTLALAALQVSLATHYIHVIVVCFSNTQCSQQGAVSCRNAVRAAACHLTTPYSAVHLLGM